MVWNTAAAKSAASVTVARSTRCQPRGGCGRAAIGSRARGATRRVRPRVRSDRKAVGSAKSLTRLLIRLATGHSRHVGSTRPLLHWCPRASSRASPSAPRRTRKAGRAGRCSRRSRRAEAVLHDAVLTRVVGEHGDTAAGRERRRWPASMRRGRISSSRFTSMRMAWNVRLAGWPPRATGRRGDGVPHDARRARPSSRSGAPPRWPRRCGWRSARRRGPEHAGQLARSVAVDDVGRRPGRRRVHPHVERAVVAVAEPTLGLVELRRADPEVEEHTGDWCRCELGHDVSRWSNRACAASPGRRRAARARGRGRECLGVPVDPDQARRAGFEQQPGVSSTADRRIHHHARGHRPEELDDLLGHHRGGGEIGRSRCLDARRPGSPSLTCSPPAGGCRRDFSPTGETEAGGVGAVHLADRETAGERQVAAPCVVRIGPRGAPFERTGWGSGGSDVRVSWARRGAHLRNGRPLPSGRRPRARRW